MNSVGKVAEAIIFLKQNELQTLDMAVGRSRAVKTLVEQVSKFQTKSRMAGVQKCRPFTVLVEGNIGCGKTTFLQHFAKVSSHMLNFKQHISENINLPDNTPDNGQWTEI